MEQNSLAPKTMEEIVSNIAFFHILQRYVHTTPEVSDGARSAIGFIGDAQGETDVATLSSSEQAACSM